MKPVLKLLPLLLIYLTVIILYPSPGMKGDQGAYVNYAERIAGLIHSDQPMMWRGPGYCLTLIPFVVFKIPLIWARLLNALFLFGAVLFFRKTVARFCGAKIALIAACLFGLYPPFLRYLPLLLTECLGIFLISGLMFFVCELWQSGATGRKKLALQAGATLFLGYLALTKILFGQVIAVGILVHAVLCLFYRTEPVKRMLMVYLLSLIICLPWLRYTHSVSGKYYYWGASGGMSLYWMTAPEDNQWGTWFSFKNVETMPELEPYRPFFAEVRASGSVVAQDEAFKTKARENIKKYPKAFIRNWAANIGRLLFSFPNSFEQQKLSTYFYVVPNMFLVVFGVCAVPIALMRWKMIPLALYEMIFFVSVALGGNSLVAVEPRQFLPAVPGILCFLFFVYTRLISIRLMPPGK